MKRPVCSNPVRFPFFNSPLASCGQTLFSSSLWHLFLAPRSNCFWPGLFFSLHLCGCRLPRMIFGSCDAPPCSYSVFIPVPVVFRDPCPHWDTKISAKVVPSFFAFSKCLLGSFPRTLPPIGFQTPRFFAPLLLRHHREGVFILVISADVGLSRSFEFIPTSSFCVSHDCLTHFGGIFFCRISVLYGLGLSGRSPPPQVAWPCEVLSLTSLSFCPLSFSPSHSFFHDTF